MAIDKIPRQRKPKNLKKGLSRLGLYGFIFFHLFSIVVAPNGTGQLGVRTSFVTEPYLKVFEFMTSWSFFAPDPGPPPMYLEWELLDSQGNSLELTRWPTDPSPFFFRERQNRRLASVRFMLAEDARAEKMMIPYLCHTHPEANVVRLWRIVFPPTVQSPTMPSDTPSSSLLATKNGKFDRHWIAHGFCETEQATKNSRESSEKVSVELRGDSAT